MSMTLMVRVMGLKIGHPIKKLVLLKLADNANDQGECWPSYSHIADQCEIGKSTARKHIKELEEMGLLRLENRKGPKGNSSNLYHLVLHPVAPDSTGCSTTEHTPVAPRSTGTSHIEPVKETVNEPLAVEWPSYITKEIQLEINTLRKNAKAPLTDRSKKMLIKEFDLAIANGYTIDQCIDQWSISGWRSFKAEWMRNKVQPQSIPKQVVQAREQLMNRPTEQQKQQVSKILEGLRA